MPAAYYNEIDPYAAQWLRNLIAAGHIAPGDVDERSILDVAPDDLAGYVQCHFFAGIGVWSHALRLACWPDDRPVWTGSCPCQPFSVAGVGSGMDDERHLWPYWFHLIEQCRPRVVFGEQVEAAIRHGWLDLVQADLEGIGYACAAAGIPAAGVGAPHIRSRLWFVAHDDDDDGREGLAHVGLRRAELHDADRRRADGGLDHHHHQGLEGLGRGHQATCGRQGSVRPTAEAGELGGVGYTELVGARRNPGAGARAESRACLRAVSDDAGSSGAVCGLDDATGARHVRQIEAAEGEAWRETRLRVLSEGLRQDKPEPTGPINGNWRAADWLLCRDGKWRPVEPGTFPLAHGAPARVGRLRAYGNAIVPQVAAEVIAAFMECRP